MSPISRVQLKKLGFLILALLSLGVKIVESKCRSDCNLALASYYVMPGATVTLISTYLNASVDDIVSYNPAEIPNKDTLPSNVRINVPFSCGCVNDAFLGHVFSYQFQKGDTYEKVAGSVYANLTTANWIQQLNNYSPFNVPDGAFVNVPINCSCGDSSVSKEYGLFITYPLRPDDSLSSISQKFNLSESLLQSYNPHADFSAGTGLVYIPGKDKNGQYPPLRSSSSTISGLSGGAIAGISIAALVVVIILSVGSYLGCIRRKRTREASLLSEKSEYQLTHSDAIAQVGDVIGMQGVIVDKSVEYSYEELAKATDNFSISSKIGQGGFGAVYYGELRNEKAAVKKMDMQASREFLAELKVLTHVHHLNLVRLLGYCVEDSLFLVYEFIDNGNLSQHLRSSARDPLPWSTRVQIALDSARGLEYIHEHTVPVYVHRDIKPANILINKNFQAKVADFGLAKLTEVGNATLPRPGKRVVRFGYGSGLCLVRVNFGLSPFGSGTGSDRVKFGFGSISGQSCSGRVWVRFG
uniref:Protein kinase domain-containing protein n=1 Tax=Opuntia streptacantha TaxID=393608 RepID=A0A7C9AFJ1_OPUST